MQFNFKKVLACALSAAMILTAAPMTGITANAAAKVKLSATKGTIKVGETKEVTIKNTKKSNIKKVTFKYSKSGIVKAKRSGLTINFTGKKKGTSTVTVKVKLKKAVAGKKSYTLKYKATVKKAAATKAAVTGVSLSNSTPKVGDTISAKLTPSDASNVAGYAWATGDAADGTFTAIAGQTASSLTVTAAMKGKFIKLTVTDADGKTFEATTTAAVAEDASSAVSISDDYGVQSDGTGIITDRLRVTFGADFGVPKAITWYRDGAVLTSLASEGAGIDGNLTHTVTAAEGTGTYYAVVTDASGKNHKTNEIVISKTEDAAKITSFTIEDDYTDGSDITYQATTGTQVATVVMNKNFQGTFRLYKKSDTKYANVVDTAGTAANAPAGNPRTTDAGADTGTDATTTLTASAGTNYDVLQQTAGSGQGYIANDGTVTYKWIVNGNAGYGTTGLVRGEEYVVVFDQLSKVEDNIGGGKENKFETAVASPYVTKPTKAEVTKAAKNAPVEVTFYTGENGDKVASFMGMQAAINGVNAIGAKATSDIYSATKSGVETKDANKKTATLNTANSLKAGVWTVSSTVVSGTDAFWFASIDFNKGIYGKDEFTLRSGDKQVAYDAATAATISYDKSKPNDVKVSFGNLRADSTVYLVALNDANGTGTAVTAATVSDEIPSAAFTRVYENPASQSVAYADVAAGAGDYTFTGAIKGITLGDGAGANAKAGNSYIAVIIPKDETNYSPTYTGQGVTGGDDTAWTGFTAGDIADVKATLTTYKIAGKGEFLGEAASYADGAAFAGTTDTALLGYDQFGKALETTAFAEVKAGIALTCDTPTVAVTPGTATTLDTTASTNGGVTCYGILTIKSGGATTNKGETWSVKLSTGQTFVATATTADGTAKAATTWSVTLK